MVIPATADHRMVVCLMVMTLEQFERLAMPFVEFSEYLTQRERNDAGSLVPASTHGKGLA